jgi:hypothetical protein
MLTFSLLVTIVFLVLVIISRNRELKGLRNMAFRQTKLLRLIVKLNGKPMTPKKLSKAFPKHRGQLIIFNEDMDITLCTVAFVYDMGWKLQFAGTESYIYDLPPSLFYKI